MQTDEGMKARETVAAILKVVVEGLDRCNREANAAMKKVLSDPDKPDVRDVMDLMKANGAGNAYNSVANVVLERYDVDAVWPLSPEEELEEAADEIR